MVTSTWQRLAELPVRIDAVRLRRLERPVSSGFLRVTTLVELRGQGQVGAGEDVTYDSPDQDLLQQHGVRADLTGDWTLAEFSERLGATDLFPEPPRSRVSRRHRRWAFESAALDLALRQQDRSLPAALELPARPVEFVVSVRLGEPPSMEPLAHLRSLVPGLRFKLDPTSSWSEQLIAELAATGSVVCVDLKGAYRGTPVDQPADPVLYRRVVEGLPGVWIEDPALTPETRPILEPHAHRITWDAILHAAEDIRTLPFSPRMLNVKPSRFGSVEELLAFYDHCKEAGISLYGGGQFELGPGRGQIQILAALFHPDAPNDVAPADYHAVRPEGALPASPLPAAPLRIGFGRRAGV